MNFPADVADGRREKGNNRFHRWTMIFWFIDEDKDFLQKSPMEIEKIKPQMTQIDKYEKR
jgi:hypothetical protein